MKKIPWHQKNFIMKIGQIWIRQSEPKCRTGNFFFIFFFEEESLLTVFYEFNDDFLFDTFDFLLKIGNFCCQRFFSNSKLVIFNPRFRSFFYEWKILTHIDIFVLLHKVKKFSWSFLNQKYLCLFNFAVHLGYKWRKKNTKYECATWYKWAETTSLINFMFYFIFSGHFLMIKI